MRHLVQWACAAAAATASPASAADLPRLVRAYADSLVQQCQAAAPAAAAANLVQEADLDGDGKVEWIVDANRYPCPARPAIAAEAGPPITVFRAVDGGHAAPVFQRPGFGSRLHRTPAGTVVLAVTVGGEDCGAMEATSRCERSVAARPSGWELAPFKPAGAR